MKKTILLIAVLFSFTCAQAQLVRLGLKAGPGLSSVRNDALTRDFTYKLKLHGGLLLNVPLSRLLHLQPEVVYAQKGFEYKNGSTISELKSAYIDVPLMARLNLDAIFVEAGPQISFLMNAKMNASDIGPATRSTVFGYGVGLGYQARDFHYGLRYTTDVSDTFVRLLGRPSEGRNVGFQLSLGYIIHQ